MKILFMDVDGVLNGHEYSPEAESCLIRPDCIANMSKVLTQTSAKVVISSAWRYMIHGGAMTLRGFEYLLRTHGLAGIKDRIIGITRKDVDQTSQTERGEQIADWLAEHPEVTRYVVVDDLDLGISQLHPFVQTDKVKGLTIEDADRIIALLGKG